MEERTIVDGRKGDPGLVLAHGAGGPMDSAFLDYYAKAVASRGFRVVRFEFPYMRKRGATGSRRPPDRLPVLEATWRDIVEELGGGARLVIGGRSMGGRIASRVADELEVRGLICLGYPFHPPGRPEKLRTAHLELLSTPTLIVQGVRDPFGSPEEIGSYALSPRVQVVFLPDGDHSFRPRKRSGETEVGNWARAVERSVEFLEALP